MKQLKKASPEKTDAELAELVDEAVELYKNQRNAEQQEKKEEELKQYATDHPWGAFATARSLNLISGFTVLPELYFQRDNKYGYDTNAAGFTLAKDVAVIDQTIQNEYNWEITVSGKKNEDSNSTDEGDKGNSIDLFDFAYNVVTGGIDNGLRIVAGGGNPYVAGEIMFSQVTASSLIEGKEKGYTDEKALEKALGSAIFEALAEKMSWDKTLKGGKGFLKNMANGFLAEGAEGVSTNWMNRVMDLAVNGEYSEVSKAYQEALADNLSEEEALKEVVGQMVAEDVVTFLQEGTVGKLLSTDVYMYNKIFGKNEGISGTESVESATVNEVSAQENAADTKEVKEEISGQTVEKAEDSGYNTTKPKETLEEPEKIEDNGGVEGGSTTKPYANSRPSYGKNQVDEVWENAKDPITGKVYDPSGVEITWDKTKPRNGQWDMGHIPGEKYSEMHQLYMDDVISKDEFLNWYRNPQNYRPELPGTNRSYKYE